MSDVFLIVVRTFLVEKRSGGCLLGLINTLKIESDSNCSFLFRKFPPALLLWHSLICKFQFPLTWLLNYLFCMHVAPLDYRQSHSYYGLGWWSTVQTLNFVWLIVQFGFMLVVMSNEPTTCLPHIQTHTILPFNFINTLISILSLDRSVCDRVFRVRFVVLNAIWFPAY